MERFWLDKSCLTCEQGRLFIIEDLVKKSLYLHCEKCECGWESPEDLTPNKSFLAIDNIHIKFADKEKIEKLSWAKYSIKSIEE